jgi:hypothetical protein
MLVNTNNNFCNSESNKPNTVNTPPNTASIYTILAQSINTYIDNYFTRTGYFIIEHICIREEFHNETHHRSLTITILDQFQVLNISELITVEFFPACSQYFNRSNTHAVQTHKTTSTDFSFSLLRVQCFPDSFVHLLKEITGLFELLLITKD